jgi:DNA-directed RNA polymerase subunit E'/Rpb7
MSNSQVKILTDVTVHPRDLDAGINTLIHQRVHSRLSNRQINGVGLVQRVVSVSEPTQETVKSSGSVTFYVVALADVYMVKPGDIVSAPVKNVSVHGFYLDLPIELFVGTTSRPDVKVGDKVSVKILTVSWNKEQYIVIGKSE